MRVLLVPASYLPVVGGHEINVQNLTKHLRLLGHEVVILTSKWWNLKLPSYELIEGVAVHRTLYYVFRGSIKSLLAFLFCLPIGLVQTFLLIHKFKPDVVNVHYAGPNCFYFWLLRPWIRRPMIITLHGGVEPPDLGPECLQLGYTATEARIMNAVCVRLLKHCSRVVGVSQKLADRAREVSAREPRYFSAIRVGVNVPVRNGKSDDYGNYVLFIGRLMKVKGLDVLLRSLALLPVECESLRVLVAGDGPERSHLENLAKELGVQSRLTFLGMVDRPRIQQLLEGCRFLVVPSRAEGFPTVNVEALVHGKPVIASAVDGIPEIIKEGETGLLVNRDDPEALAKAMTFLWSNPEQGRLMGERGRNLVEREYSWETLAAKYVELYETLIAVGPTRDEGIYPNSLPDIEDPERCQRSSNPQGVE